MSYAQGGYGGPPQGQGGYPPQQQGGGYNNGYGQQGGGYGGGQQGNYAPQEPQWIAQARNEINQGQFPHHNAVELVGQVAPSDAMPNGFEWKPSQTGGQGMLQINLKVRKQTQPRNGPSKVKRFLIRVVVFGQKGQQLMNNLQVGSMLAVSRAVGTLVPWNGWWWADAVVRAGSWAGGGMAVGGDGW